MKRLHYILLLITSLLLLPTLQAQTTGTVAGRVSDGSTKLPLAGARVTIANTALESYTDRDGSYVFYNVPAGEQTLGYNYVGYPGMAKTVTVTVGSTATANAAFGGDMVEMEKFVIEGALVGTARAINQQRASDTLRNIVASDEIGNFPDENAAEALQRVPGLALYRDQGEGRYIIVRGVNYALNSVTLNGAKLASPEEGDRGIALDVIPSDALASVEVTKVATPDMDGEGLGGQVNIKTKSPFDSEGTEASLNVRGIYSNITGEMGQKFNASYSTLSKDGTFGILIAPTWQKRKFGSANFEEDGYALENSPTDNQDYYVLEAMNFRDYQIERKRYGATVALESKPAEETHLFLRSTYNRFTDNEYRNRSVFDFTEGTLIAADANSATFNKQRRWRRDVRLREKDQELFALLAGGEARIGEWDVDGQLAWSRGKEKNPGESSVRFRHNTRDGSFRYTMHGPYALQLEQLAGGDINDPTTYDYQRIDYSNDTGNEDEFDAGFNAKIDLNHANPTTLKFGVMYRAKQKDKEVEVYELDSAPASFTFASLAADNGDYPFTKVPRVDGDRASEAFFGNFSAFSGDRIFEDSELEDWVSNEDVLAAYIMGTVKLGATTLIAGTRVERTKFDTTGNELDIANEVVTGRNKVSRNYTSWLPGVYLRHNASENLVLRASWSNSLARPSFGESAAFTGINHDDAEVTQGNPALEALTARNWDASVEYYLPSLGLVSAGVFLKEIDNFSYQIRLPGGYVPLPTYDLTTFRNGSDGKIKGLELSYQQQLRMLPAPFDGLGLLANLTLSDSEASYPTRPGENLPFIGQSDRIGNLGFTYEAGGFFARLALNFRSERLREDEPIGGNRYEDRWVDDFQQLDFTMRYRFSKNIEGYVEFVNITNEPFRVYFKSPANQGPRLVQFEEYGWTSNFGVSWKL
ncbi:MAG: TonB-dependent receptor [Cephaloticoccus sp.]|nr:TonB-dependent receptor [Cephaloticoccus sp.]MCF7759663.1 TonB-dependent receptor [Cephaloticoccus sp.]